VELPEPLVEPVLEPVEPAPLPVELPAPVDPEPVDPDPDGVLPVLPELELPEVPLLPEPLLDCAAARAGAKAIIPIRSTKVTLNILCSSEVWKSAGGSPPQVVTKAQQYPGRRVPALRRRRQSSRSARCIS
jgi:hypothetical protein